MPEFDLLKTLIIIAGVLAFVLGTVAYLILAERKVSAWVQDRIGPNRVGPLGLLQPIADGGKMFLKEDIIPKHVDKAFYVLAPAIAMGTALLAMVVVPWGPTVPPPQPIPTTNNISAVDQFQQAEQNYSEQFQGIIAPGIDAGMLYLFAIGSLAVYGIILGGWSANNKYTLIGSLRSSAQIISYEIPLGMSIVGVLLFAGSLNLETIIGWQVSNGWNVFYQPLAFLLFMTSVYAECNRLPFDLPEAEQELVGGYHTEYSSLKFGMFFLGEYTHMITTSFLLSIVFLGGWGLFGLENSLEDPIAAAVLKIVIMGGKMSFFIFLYLLVRWTIPRFRFDQLMGLAWKALIPLAILHLVAVMLVRYFDMPLWSLSAISLTLFFSAGVVAVVIKAKPNNTPRRRSAMTTPRLTPAAS